MARWRARGEWGRGVRRSGVAVHTIAERPRPGRQSAVKPTRPLAVAPRGHPTPRPRGRRPEAAAPRPRPPTPARLPIRPSPVRPPRAGRGIRPSHGQRPRVITWTSPRCQSTTTVHLAPSPPVPSSRACRGISTPPRRPRRLPAALDASPSPSTPPRRPRRLPQGSSSSEEVSPHTIPASPSRSASPLPPQVSHPEPVEGSRRTAGGSTVPG